MRKISGSPALDPLARETLFEELTVDLVMEGGDADTIAAAAGALLGAYLGYANLPSHWTLGLAHKEWLLGMTYRLPVALGVTPGNMEPEEDEAEDGGRGLLGEMELVARSSLIAAMAKQRMKDGKAQEREKKARKD